MASEGFLDTDKASGVVTNLLTTLQALGASLTTSAQSAIGQLAVGTNLTAPFVAMDTTRWGRVREYLAGKADLVGAIRLPGTAFAKNAGTDVTTDILILRKKDGRPFEGQPWRQVEKVETPEGQAGVNEYFVAHPEMVLGRHSLTGSMGWIKQRLDQ